MSKNHAAIIPKAQAQLEVTERGIPSPGADEVLIRVKAIAINPLDWKIQAYDIYCDTYPMVLGTDAAGEVVSVGSNATLFKAGDRVASFAGALNLNNADYGAFQEYALMKTYNTSKIPDTMSFEEAAVLPTGVATAGMSLFQMLGIPRIQAGISSAGEKEGFLIWGASSAMGIAAVQQAKAAGFTVYVTASQGHHAALKDLGADHCFDYKASDVVEQVVNAAKKNGDHINFGFDSIAEGTTSPTTLQILSQTRNGKAALCATLPFPEGATKPEGTEAVMVNALSAPSKDNADITGYLFNEWLPTALKEGKYKSAPVARVEGKSVADVQKAMDVQKKGVSGKKVVVSFE